MVDGCQPTAVLAQRVCGGPQAAQTKTQKASLGPTWSLSCFPNQYVTTQSVNWYYHFGNLLDSIYLS